MPDPQLGIDIPERSASHPVLWRRRVTVAVVILVVAAAASWAVTQAVSQDPTSAGGAGPARGESRTGATTSTTAAPQPPFAVQDETVSLTDFSRYTEARGDVPAQSGRVLTTVIRRPVGAVGPLPLVVFAHGWDSDPQAYETLLD